jgi:hypothetical protein
VVEQSPRHSTPHTAKSQMPIVVYNAEFAITWQHGLEFFYVFFFVKIILMFFLFFFRFLNFVIFKDRPLKLPSEAVNWLQQWYAINPYPDRFQIGSMALRCKIETLRVQVLNTVVQNNLSLLC